MYGVDGPVISIQIAGQIWAKIASALCFEKKSPAGTNQQRKTTIADGATKYTIEVTII